MRVSCFAVEPGGALVAVEESAALATWRGGGGPFWIDLAGVSSTELAEWLRGTGLEPGRVDLVKAEEDEARIVLLDDFIFVAYPFVKADEAGQADRASHFGLLCLEGLVVTAEAAPDGMSAVDRSRIPGFRLRESTTAGIVCGLTVLHSTRGRKLVVRLRGQADALSDRMDADTFSVPLPEILALKKNLFSVGGVVDEQLAVLEIMKGSPHSLLPLPRIAETLAIGIELARATDHDVDRLERRVRDLQLRYETAQQEVTNRRLGVLTVLSAIFMPLSLVAGIYGMNFDVMPELHFRYGYPCALGAMALMAGGLGWYFRSRWSRHR